MFKTILFPTDFSEPSIHALNTIIPQVIKMGAKKIFLVYVYEGFVGDEAEASLAVSTYEKNLSEYVDKVRELGVEAMGLVRVGIASEQISTVAKENNVDLIILPSKGENILREMFLGSTASNLVRISEKPVLLLKIEWDKRLNKIVSECKCEAILEKPLIALDFSKCSENIVDFTNRFKEYMKEVTLIHVIDYGKPEDIDRYREEAHKKLSEYCSKIGLPCSKRVEVGIASKNILNVAGEEDNTLIIIGKKGRSRIKDLLLGSTAERIIRVSSKPVLLHYCKPSNKISYIS